MTTVPLAAPAHAPGRAAPLPWHVVAVLVAATSTVVGVIWDISWHRAIGRDTFWTPAHMAIYLGGVLAGLSCGFVVLKTTFAGTPGERAAAVRFWGFRGPLGAWVAIWGAFAMITSAPFDNWWHNAYGLDVRVLSPPHVLLALGFTGIQLGALLMTLALQNRPGAASPVLKLLYAYAGGLLVCNVAIMLFEYVAFPNHWHQPRFYEVAGFAFPIVLVAVARASRLSWPATTTAAVYVSVTLLMLWILEAFPATPRLAPIYRDITHMVPPPFPILLVVPALALDVVLRRLRGRSDWAQAAAAGAVFVGVLLVVQWTVAPFLVSPRSYNVVFGVGRQDYASLPGPWEYRFWNGNIGLGGATPFAWIPIAMALAFLSSRIGLAWGKWMARVKR